LQKREVAARVQKNEAPPKRPGLRINNQITSLENELGRAALPVAVLILFIILRLTLITLFRLLLLLTGLPALLLALPMLARLTALLTLPGLAALLTLFFHIVCHELLLLKRGRCARLID
jgi:hypothetical protein